MWTKQSIIAATYDKDGCLWVITLEFCLFFCITGFSVPGGANEPLFIQGWRRPLCVLTSSRFTFPSPPTARPCTTKKQWRTLPNTARGYSSFWESVPAGWISTSTVSGVLSHSCTEEYLMFLGRLMITSATAIDVPSDITPTVIGSVDDRHGL